jgi:DNA-binding CsgD family transcriptional regulator
VDEALDWLDRERAWLPGGDLVPSSQLLLTRALRLAGDPTAAEVADALITATAGRPSIHAAAVAERAHLAGDLGLHHEALRIRSARGLVLGCVDSLEAIAAILADQGDPGTAGVLSAAAARARAEHGYNGGTHNGGTHNGGTHNGGTHNGGTYNGDTYNGDMVAPDAMDLADAVALAQRARGPRRRPASGWASLTPTEESVVALAVQGLSNPDIAARLYIGRGTVNTHLSHVYAKLGVANRTDLTRLATLRAQEPP